MNKYSLGLGKVYEIVCNVTGNKYIGATCEERLSARLASHKSAFNRFINGKTDNYITSFEILKENDYYINLLEKVTCNTKDELKARERYYINTVPCVNKNKPLRTSKEYYKDNFVIINAKKSVKNICECGGKYRTDNKSYHSVTDKHYNYMAEKMTNETINNYIDLTCLNNGLIIGEVIEDYSHNLIVI